MKRSRTLTNLMLYSLAFLVVFFSISNLAMQSAFAGGLKISPTNPRYFEDSNGKIVYLTGAHTWSNMQDPSNATFNWDAYIAFLISHNHNFFRLWHYEQTKSIVDGTTALSPHPYARTGPGNAHDGLPKFDLTKWNQSYFDRMRSRIIDARSHGMYVSIMLFNGFSLEDKAGFNYNCWLDHPYNSANNINGVNGDANGDGKGTECNTLAPTAIVALQENYVKKVIDSVDDLDNVLYEICNESNGGTSQMAWQQHMVTYIKNYEATLPNQHPVGITVPYPNGNNSDLFNSNADWISPNHTASGGYDYITNPPPADGSKVIIADTDHLWGIGGDRVWAWESFIRGMNVAYMDPYDSSANESLLNNMGYICQYANKMSLSTMTPQPSLSSTGYCLANMGHEYIVYSPSDGTFTLNLTSAPGGFSAEWFNPSTGNAIAGGTISGGTQESFTPPFSGDAVLYLKYTSATNTTPPAISHNAPATLTISCTQGSSPSSKTFDVWNSGSGTLNYTISTNQTWLSCTPSSGTSTGGHSTITIIYATSGLSAGAYSSTITISAPGATNSPQTIPVCLTISDQINPGQLTFSMDPASLAVSCTQGSDAADQSFQAWNLGNETLNYSISADAAWMTLSPSSGTLTGDHTIITVHLKTSSLAVGEYDQNITISSTDADVTNSPQTIPVHLSVKGAEAYGKGGGGGGCFISTTVSDDIVLQGMLFLVLVGMMLIGIVKVSRKRMEN